MTFARRPHHPFVSSAVETLRLLPAYLDYGLRPALDTNGGQ